MIDENNVINITNTGKLISEKLISEKLILPPEEQVRCIFCEPEKIFFYKIPKYKTRMLLNAYHSRGQSMVYACSRGHVFNISDKEFFDSEDIE